MGRNPDAEGILITAINWEQGLRWMGIHLRKLSCLEPLFAGCVVDNISNSHLELSVISRPTEDSPFLMKAALLSMVCGSPLMHPSRYQKFRSDLTSDVTHEWRRQKEPG